MIETITDTEEIANFTLALDADQWSLSSLPSNASELGSFGFSQQETVKLFDTNPDKSLYDVATIVLYEGGYIDVEIVNLDWFNVTFAVSEDTYNYLKAYFE